MTMSEVSTPQPTSVSEWRKPDHKGFMVELPSGKSVRMFRNMDMLALLKQGRIPNPLAGMVQEMINKGGAVDMDKLQLDTDTLQQLLDLMDECVAKVVIEPKVIRRPDDASADWEPPEDALEVGEIDIQDRLFIYTVAQGGATDLTQFREQQDKIMATTQDGPRVQPKAKRASRAK